TAVLPLVSRHKMSPLPSPLKSATPATDHELGMLPTPADEKTCVPIMNHIAVLPLVSRHSKSYVPSPLKSRWPTIDQLAGAEPAAADSSTWVPFISQTAMLVPLRHTMSLKPSPLESWVSTSLLAAGTATPAVHGAVEETLLFCVNTIAGRVL